MKKKLFGRKFEFRQLLMHSSGEKICLGYDPETTDLAYVGVEDLGNPNKIWHERIPLKNIVWL